MRTVLEKPASQQNEHRKIMKNVAAPSHPRQHPKKKKKKKKD
jgi:hypothetical protein